MAKRRNPDPKHEALREHGCLNPHPQQVRDVLFASGDFFDPRDLVQVKYEMLRRSQAEGRPVSQCAASFGFSRPTFYQAQAAFAAGGLPALVPKKRGPRRAHKLSADVVAFLSETLSGDPALTSAQLAGRVEERFAVHVHPRSIERALARQEKKQQKRASR